MRRLLVVSALMVLGCGGNSPTTPSAPPPPPAANLVSSGQGNWSVCSPSGSCLFLASIQNTGAGCATNTSVVVRFYNSASAQVGADIQMGGQGTSLSGRIIRPSEVVGLASVSLVSSTVVSGTATYQLFPTWTNVAC